MNKIKIIIIGGLIPFLALIAFNFWQIKKKEDYRQRTVLAQDTRKVLEQLMPDIYQAHAGSFVDLPADGVWHHRFSFDCGQEGLVEYIIKDGQLFKDSKNHEALVADNIAGIRIRRQKETPDIMEIQIEARHGVSLISNFKIRIRQ